MVTLYIEPEDVKFTNLIEKADVLVVARAAHRFKIEEVWDSDGEIYYGTLPHPALDEACIALKQSYQRGLDAGIAVGRAQLQRELKGLLGVAQ